MAASSSRLALPAVALVALGALAAMVLGIRLAYSSWEHRPGAPQQLTASQLRPGDCLTGSDLSLGTGSPLPSTVTAVPCTQRHLAEVIFTRNLWPASLTTYPSVLTVVSIADNRCQEALYAYAGRSNPSLSYDSIAPTAGNDWNSGDRHVLCMAYEPGVVLLQSVKAARS